MQKEYTADEITDALEAIYDYMVDAEKSHYQACTRAEKKNHIYESVKALGYYLQHAE